MELAAFLVFALLALGSALVVVFHRNPVYSTMALVVALLATALSYLSGITLGLLPVMREQHVTWVQALRIIWIGEVISIGVMEVVMNFVDYSVGGMAANSVATWQFWRGLAFAIPAGFVAAWPVNYWLLKRELKACR